MAFVNAAVELIAVWARSRSHRTCALWLVGTSNWLFTIYFGHVMFALIAIVKGTKPSEVCRFYGKRRAESCINIKVSILDPGSRYQWCP